MIELNNLKYMPFWLVFFFEKRALTEAQADDLELIKSLE